MKNDFLQIYLNGKNEFRTNAEFSLNELYFSNVSVKIDTGCPRTSFPIQKLGISSSEAYNMKLNDCQDDSIKKSISFGVNDSKLKKEMDKKKFHSKRYMELDSISFRHGIDNFHLQDIKILMQRL